MIKHRAVTDQVKKGNKFGNSLILASILAQSLHSYMTAYYLGSSEPLSNDTRVIELMAQTLVLGANTTQEWIDTTGVYWSNQSTWWNLVGAHPSKDQYGVSTAPYLFEDQYHVQILTNYVFPGTY